MDFTRGWAAGLLVGFGTLFFPAQAWSEATGAYSVTDVGTRATVALAPYFTHFPQLTRAATSNISSSYDYARYSFTIEVPEDSGAALGGLVIGVPASGWHRVPNQDTVSAVDGQGKPVALARIEPGAMEQKVAPGDHALVLTFAQPVAAGQSVTVQFYPMRNPRQGGSFLFDIAAFPAGEPSPPRFLGFGRITFYQGSGGHR
ncbi:DUF2808 domain-containing protein [Anthocerotibacter panamensis]|uniref:DUF2808 domain-containing protein n=1 Tax=Anthocerotibacter panamensis TaxID=2857077 RepID=UPI001C401A7F|nr:DUF2808 domain-containing protein [Anthocerotibacter panamensis]